MAYEYAKREPRTELTRLRWERFPETSAQQFAERLGISRMHMTSIEQGRRDPSLDLAARWLELLGPEAKVEMFGTVTVLEAAPNIVRSLKRLRPDLFAA
jgi:transcriptional regulator with XRE-family HTH domain